MAAYCARDEGGYLYVLWRFIAPLPLTTAWRVQAALAIRGAGGSSRPLTGYDKVQLTSAAYQDGR